MRLLAGALGSLNESGEGLSHASDHEFEVGPEGSDSVAWPGRHSGAHPSSFIRRCWFPERTCDESSTCSDLRTLWNTTREDVKVLPPPEVCGRSQYIVTGASITHRNGIMDENRLETLMFPGEKWHKCCIIVNPKNKKATPRFVCEHLKEVPRLKLMTEMKGQCGTHKCIGPRDRCLIVDEEKIDGYKPKFRGECPFKCQKGCNKISQKFECIYIGKEPPLGQEGSETPMKLFSETEPYDVIGLGGADDPASKDAIDTAVDAAKDPLKTSAEEGGEPAPEKESCAPLEAAFFLPAPVAAEDRSARHRRWNHFLG